MATLDDPVVLEKSALTPIGGIASSCGIGIKAYTSYCSIYLIR